MLRSFTTERVDVGEVVIALEVGGSGPPVLLLHGYPQTRAMWRSVAPRLADRFTVVAADLRGYGASSKPPGDPEHVTYSKRAMSADQVTVMRRLGFERFLVAGHDRGGRVAHRMCLDHPDSVLGAAVLDIVPTHHLFTTAGKAFAEAYYHWFFLAQRPDLPERLIGGAKEYFLRTTLDRWSAPGFGFDEAAVAGYVEAFDEATIHASCEDYRAAASIDLVHDEADADRLVECPLLVLWGGLGSMERLYDVPGTWRARATDVRGRLLRCGHFLPEEAPDETARALLEFFTSLDTGR